MKTLKMNSETFWWIRPNSNSSAFNEDADDRPAHVTTAISSTLDTHEIDRYRQGVEITTWRHWTQGTYKIHAGEPGGIVNPENYGLRDLSLSTRTFVDRNIANPSLFLSSSANIEHRTSYLLPSIPPVKLDRGDAERHLYDGVLDVLDVRDAATTFGGDFPSLANGVVGAVMAGNIDSERRCEIIVSFITPVNSSSLATFKDNPQIYGLRWPNTRSVENTALEEPFIDRVYKNLSPIDSQIASVVNRLSGSEDFIPQGCRASTSGWVYDDGIGTDSITFGGLTY